MILEKKKLGPSINLSEVEPIEKILKRFGSGSMSHGALSKEAHETLAKQNKIEVLGLRGLCGLFLGKRLSKKAKLSNWENKFLSKSQIHYAATDAWVSREIFFEMEKNKLFDLKKLTSLAKKEEQR